MTTVKVINIVATKDKIVAGSCIEIVITSVAIECVIAKVSRKDVITKDKIALFCALDQVISMFTPGCNVELSLSIDLIISMATMDLGGRGEIGVCKSTVDDIVATFIYWVGW